MALTVMARLFAWMTGWSVFRSGAQFAFLGILVVAARPADAQIVANDSPLVRPLIDANGVDLISGTVHYSVTELSIGPANSSGLSLRRDYYSGGWRDNLTGVISVQSGSGDYVVSFGGAAESFTRSGSTFSPKQGQTSSLAYDAPTVTYTYTSANGVVARFFKGGGFVYGLTGVEAFITSLTYPDGSKVSFNYRTLLVCYDDPCFPYANFARLQSVTNNFGYMIHFDYASNVSQGSSGMEFEWLRRTRAVALNLAFDYCAVDVATCPAFTKSWPTITYGGTSGVSETTTDSLPVPQTTTYSYDGSQRLTGVKLPGSSSNDIVFGYNGSGLISSVTAEGITTGYGFSDSGATRTSTVTDANSHTRTLTIDLSTRTVTSDADAMGRTITYLYDSLGRRTRATLPQGNYTAFAYDTRGNLTEVRQVSKTPGTPADIVLTSDFDATCSNPVKCNKPNYTIDPRGARTDYTYDPVHGGITFIDLPVPTAGAVRPRTQIEYNTYQAYYMSSVESLAASGQPVYLPWRTRRCRTLATCSGTEDEGVVTFDYGATGAANNLLVRGSTRADGAGTASRTLAVTYDEVGNPQLIDGPVSGTGDTVRRRYDRLRRLVGVVNPDPDGVGSGERIQRAERYTYDSHGRLVGTELGTVAGYDDVAWNAFVSKTKRTVVFGTNGKVARRFVSAGATTYGVQQFTYDAAGRLTCSATRMNAAAFSSLPSSACALGTQGADGPDRITKYDYNDADQTVIVTSGYLATVAPVQKIMTYTTNAKLETIKDGRGFLTTLRYDGFDRVDRVYFPDPIQVGLSSSTDYEEREYDANSNLTEYRTRNDHLPLIGEYDALNRLTKRDLPGTTSEDVFYEYDNVGHVTAARYGSSAGPGIVDTYDALGHMSSHTSYGRTLSYRYDAAGNRTRVTHPDGFYVTYEYNAAGQLTTVIDSAGVTLAAYAYDDVARVTGLGRDNGTASGYGYDAVGRLNSLTQDLSGPAFDNQLTLLYNAAGQIRSRTQTNDTYSWLGHENGTLDTPANGANQLSAINGTPTTPDPRGNLAGDGFWSYTYDAQNALRTAALGANTFALSYDPAGLLHLMSGNSISTREYLYDGAALVAQFDGSGNLIRRFVHAPGNDQPIVWYEGGSTSDRRWLHADERGSVNVVSDSNGSGSRQIGYSPYGEANQAAGAPFQYTGQLAVPELNLLYYKARFYSPKLGRFLQPDPAGFGAGMNFYGYVRGDPMNATDPSGMFEMKCFDFDVPTIYTIPAIYPNANGQGDPTPATVVVQNRSTQWCIPLPGWLTRAPSYSSPSGGDSSSDSSDTQGPAEDKLTDACPRPELVGEGRFGLFGQFMPRIFGGIRVGFDINAFRINVPADGPNYMDQGFGIGGEAFGVDGWIGFQRVSTNGGLSWSDWGWYGAHDKFSLSNDGLAFGLEGGLGVGGNIAVTHLESLLIPCAN